VNVVDDLEMGITHVIRGEDHLSNTPKHIALFRAFNVEPPKYAHIPLILNQDGTKMSKRETGAALDHYRDTGFAPEAVVNYLCLLGWSPKNNREKMPLADIIETFDLPQILRHNARFDIEKLKWLSGEYVREMSDDRFHEMCVHTLAGASIDTNKFPLEYVKAALDTCKGKFKQFSELPDYAGFYFKETFDYDPDAAKKEFTAENKDRVQRLREALANLSSFDADTIGNELAATAKSLGVKTGQLVHPTRLACTGRGAGPSLYHLIAVLGKERTLERLDRAMARVG
jgi:glutamyl-tRNA synthetase